MNYYTSQAYASGRLESTIVQTIEGEPVFIEIVKDSFYRVRSLLTLEYKEINPSSVNLTPVRLGWLNDDYSAYYLSRVPVRKWKQGLSMDNLAVDGEHTTHGSIPFKWVGEAMYNTIKNLYPSYQSVAQGVGKGKFNKRAFHRFWALDSTGNLWYKARVVGQLGKDGVMALHLNHHYLRDEFERQVGEQCVYS